MARRKTTRRRRRSVSRTPRRISSRLSGDKMMEDLKVVAAIGAGLVFGKTIAGLVDKGTNTVSGMMGIDGAELRPFIRPVVTTGVGLATNQMASHPLIKRVGLGVASYGMMDGIQKLTGQKMLAGPGLGDVPPAYLALPEYQIPVMGPDDEPEVTTTPSEEESEGTEGVGDLVNATAEDITAGLDGEGSLSSIDGDEDDLTITA